MWLALEETDNYLLLYTNNSIKGTLGRFTFFYEPGDTCDSISSPRYKWTWVNHHENQPNLFDIYVSFN